VAARIAEGSVDLANLVAGALSRLPVHPDLLPVVHAALQTFRLVAGTALAKRRRDEVVAQGLRLGLPIAPVHRPEEFIVAEQTRAVGRYPWWWHTTIRRRGRAQARSRSGITTSRTSPSSRGKLRESTKDKHLDLGWGSCVVVRPRLT
jgi:hypothetical protein